MIQPLNLSVGTVHLAARIGDPPITVDLMSFFEFSYSMAEDLEDLVAHYRGTSHVSCRADEMDCHSDHVDRRAPHADGRPIV